MAKRTRLLDQAKNGLPTTRLGQRSWNDRLAPDLLREIEEVVDAWLTGEITARKSDLGRWLESKLLEHGHQVRREMIVRWINIRYGSRQPRT